MKCPVAVEPSMLIEAITIVMASSEWRGPFTMDEMAVIAECRNLITTCGRNSLQRIAKGRGGNG